MFAFIYSILVAGSFIHVSCASTIRTRELLLETDSGMYSFYHILDL